MTQFFRIRLYSYVHNVRQNADTLQYVYVYQFDIVFIQWQKCMQTEATVCMSSIITSVSVSQHKLISLHELINFSCNPQINSSKLMMMIWRSSSKQARYTKGKLISKPTSMHFSSYFPWFCLSGKPWFLFNTEYPLTSMESFLQAHSSRI